MAVVRTFLKEILFSWKSWWLVNYFKTHLFFTIIIFAAVIHFSCLYLSIWESRTGFIIQDPLLSRLTPKEFSLQIFSIVHSSILITFILLLDNPKAILKALQGYSLALFLRTVSIYFVPLEPPAGMIFLNDPITASFLNSVHVVTKDLFFSGHISAMCVFIYFSKNKIWKTYLMLITPFLAVMILWQHVHYTLDIIAAPFFTYLCCKCIDKLNEIWAYGIDNLESQMVSIKRNNS